MFEEFVKKLSEELGRELPGFSAQKSMAPLGRRPPLDYLKKGEVPKKSAVLILLYPQQDQSSVKTVLILRPENEGGSHAGQISFPGGGFDILDKDMSETALREAEEEIGIDRTSISILGELSPLYIPVSNYMVHPFVGAINAVPKFSINSGEVKELIEVGITEFLSDKNKKMIEQFIKIKNIKMQVPCYEIPAQMNDPGRLGGNEKIIWGATAMIISELAEIINKIK